MRVLAGSVFAIAAAASALGGAGLVVVPHAEPAGSANAHVHPVTVYRFPVLLVGDAPGVPTAKELAHHVAAAHLAHLRALLGQDGPSMEPVHPLAEVGAATVLALLVVAVPRLPRPTRRAIAEIPIPAIAAAQCAPRRRSPPPRVRVFATA